MRSMPKQDRRTLAGIMLAMLVGVGGSLAVAASCLGRDRAHRDDATSAFPEDRSARTSSGGVPGEEAVGTTQITGADLPPGGTPATPTATTPTNSPPPNFVTVPVVQVPQAPPASPSPAPPVQPPPASAPTEPVAPRAEATVNINVNTPPSAPVSTEPPPASTSTAPPATTSTSPFVTDSPPFGASSYQSLRDGG